MVQNKPARFYGPQCIYCLVEIRHSCIPASGIKLFWMVGVVIFCCQLLVQLVSECIRMIPVNLTVWLTDRCVSLLNRPVFVLSVYWLPVTGVETDYVQCTADVQKAPGACLLYVLNGQTKQWSIVVYVIAGGRTCSFIGSIVYSIARHGMPCTSSASLSVVWQHKLVSGWRLRNPDQCHSGLWRVKNLAYT